SSSPPSSTGSARRTVPRHASASVRPGISSKVTIQRSWWGVARPTVSVPRSVAKVDPGSRRDVRSELKATSTSPRTPWGFVIRPTSSSPIWDLSCSVFEFDVDVDAVADGGGADDGADGVGHPAPLPDHAAHVVGTDAHLEADPVTLLDLLDAHGIRVVDERRDQEVEDRGGG